MPQTYKIHCFLEPKIAELSSRDKAMDPAAAFRPICIFFSLKSYLKPSSEVVIMNMAKQLLYIGAPSLHFAKWCVWFRVTVLLNSRQFPFKYDQQVTGTTLRFEIVPLQ